jgi:hypothetical protein
MSDRIQPILENLQLLYEQLDAAEKAAIREVNAISRKKYEQEIRDTLLPDVRKYEQQYVIALSQQVKKQDPLLEPIAETIVGELVDELEMIEPIAKTDEMRSMLQEILLELRKDVPASAKLKIAIPIIPNVVTYELEGDTETVVRRLFPTFVKVYEALTPKK